jgi:hypothetical protein
MGAREQNPVLLWHIFKVKPIAALSILLCLITILACVLLERRRPHQRSDRFLIGVLGLLSVYQGLRILQASGIILISIGTTVDDVIELAITGFYLTAALMLRLSAVNHLDAESAMRLARAAPPRHARQGEPARDFILETIGWAMPRVSDGAFKLYAFLCLRAGHGSGHVSVGVHDMRLHLGKTVEDVDEHLAELEKAGAVIVTREGTSLNIELVNQNRHDPDAVADEIPKTSVSLPA